MLLLLLLLLLQKLGRPPFFELCISRSLQATNYQMSQWIAFFYTLLECSNCSHVTTQDTVNYILCVGTLLWR